MQTLNRQNLNNLPDPSRITLTLDSERAAAVERMLGNLGSEFYPELLERESLFGDSGAVLSVQARLSSTCASHALISLRASGRIEQIRPGAYIFTRKSKCALSA